MLMSSAEGYLGLCPDGREGGGLEQLGGFNRRAVVGIPVPRVEFPPDHGLSCLCSLGNDRCGWGITLKESMGDWFICHSNSFHLLKSILFIFPC